MGWPLLLAFITIPVIEIALFIKTSQWIGILPTVGLAIMAGIVGLMVLRRQGFSALMRLQAQAQNGQMPLDELFDGLCLSVAGILLVLPGFFSDILALLLLIPAVRRLLQAVLAGLLAGRVHQTVNRTSTAPDGTTIIEAEYTDITPDKPSDGPKALL